MLSMSQYDWIKTAHRVYGKSIRDISRDSGHSRNTIRKVLREVAPRYEQKKERVCPVMGSYEEVILSWLITDESMPRKQRHTARRVYTRLVAEYGFRGAESTVRRFVRHLRIARGLGKQEAFIPLEADRGEAAEVDWGEAIAMIGGKRQKIHLFCMRSKYSGKDFVRAYPNARQEMFFDGHIHAFHHFGGVYKTLVYDNLTSAVLRVLKGKNRIEQTAFQTFRSYYTFEARFCNPGKGNEKGGVEGLVGYARRNYLVPIPQVDSFAELNEQLLSCCLAHDRLRISGQEGSIGERFDAEREQLLSLPASAYPVKVLLEIGVDHYSTVRVDHNRYSVPTGYAGLQVRVELGVERVIIYHQRRCIAEHERVFGKNKWQLDPHHYLELLSRKPGAFDSARPIRQWRGSWPASYERLLNTFRHKNGPGGGTKEFIKVLLLLKEYPPELVDQAVEKAQELSICDGASVKVLLDHWFNGEEVPAPVCMEAYPHLAGYEVAAVELTSYTALLCAKGGGL